MKTYIKIYGIQRTGTNYAEWLFNNNFLNTETLKHGCMLGWKHGPPTKFSEIDWDKGSNCEYWGNVNCEENKKRVQEYLKEANAKRPDIEKARKEGRFKYIFCIRDVYSWMTSLGPRWTGSKTPEAAVDYWNRTTREYIDFYNKEKDFSFIVKHSDIVKNPSETLLKISEKFKIEFNQECFKDQDKEVCPLGEIGSDTFNKKRYFDKNNKNFYMYDFGRGTVGTISENVDSSLMRTLGLKIR